MSSRSLDSSAGVAGDVLTIDAAGNNNAHWAPPAPTAAQLPTTGLTIAQSIAPITVDDDASTITFDLAVSDWHLVTLADNRTLALAHPTVGQGFTLALKQDSGGSHTVTWFAGIAWPAATA